MAVSKHNLWKRKKNGVMKLVRSHSDWLEKRRKIKVLKSNVTTNNRWWDKSTKTKPVASNKSSTDSTKRTQVGKKV